jgi:PAS domain S-box-containing protein
MGDDSAQRDELMAENRVLREKLAELEAKLPRRPASAARAHAAECAAEGLFEHSPVMLLIADLVEGRFLQFNDTLCEVLGLTRQQILESSFLDRVHPDDHIRTMREMERLAAGRSTVNFRNRHRSADGVYRTFEWLAIADARGELCYAMAAVVDE